MLQPRWEGDRANPYVYAHPTYNTFRQVELIDTLAALHADGRAMPVYVVADNYWPLPWYLRRMENVGWFDQPPQGVDGVPVLMVEDAMYDAMVQRGRTFDDYVATPAMLRHGVGMSVLVQRDLWNAYLQQRESKREARHGGGKP
jgi:predicted membrane-bound mannosyltransferase